MGRRVTRYLLDTHTLIWALTDADRLGAASREIVSDRATEIVVSSASAWEIATKHRIGKLPRADALIGGYRRHLDRLGATRLPISEDHSLLSGGLEWAHRDPFDRMLAAQAMIESMTLVTNDESFEGLGGVRRCW